HDQLTPFACRPLAAPPRRADTGWLPTQRPALRGRRRGPLASGAGDQRPLATFRSGRGSESTSAAWLKSASRVADVAGCRAGGRARGGTRTSEREGLPT